MITQLNIRYDPEAPWNGRCVEYEDEIARLYPPDRKPWFPYREPGYLECTNFVRVNRNRIHYGGFDPSSGTEWVIAAGKLVVQLVGVFDLELEVRWGRRVIFTASDYHNTIAGRLVAKLYSRLEYRYDWYMHNEYVDDYDAFYGSYGSYK